MGSIRKGQSETIPNYHTDLPDDLRAVSDPDIRKPCSSPSCCCTCYLPTNGSADRQSRNGFTGRSKRTNLRPVIVDGLSKWQLRHQADGCGELLGRVDIVLPRLAIAQSVQETGWGTSRFAQAGNALFGQHAPLGAGAIQASGNANVALKSFDTLQDSVRDYMRNLNRNRAYRGFRAARAGMRSSQRPLDEIELVGTLALYSEEGGVYADCYGYTGGSRREKRRFHGSTLIALFRITEDKYAPTPATEAVEPFPSNIHMTI